MFETWSKLHCTFTFTVTLTDFVDFNLVEWKFFKDFYVCVYKAAADCKLFT